MKTEPVGMPYSLRILTCGVRYEIWDSSEFANEQQFFAGRFNIVVKPEGAAYFNELEAKLQSIVYGVSVGPVKRKIGFQA
jgi:hypothetical protein